MGALINSSTTIMSTASVESDQWMKNRAWAPEDKNTQTQDYQQPLSDATSQVNVDSVTTKHDS